MAKMKTLTVNGKTYTVDDPDAAHIDDTAVGAAAWSSRNIVDKLCPTFTESGAVVSCEPVEGYPLSVVSAIEAVQEGSGDPRPAGWKSIYDESMRFDIFTIQADLEEGRTYRVCYTPQGGSVTDVYIVMDGPGTEIEGVVNENYCEFTMPGSGITSISLWVDEETYEMVFDLLEYDPGNVRPITGFDAVQLTHGNIEGSSALTAVLGQTVGKGTYDWNTGVLTVTHALIRLTSDMKWAMTGASNPNGIRSFYVNENTENARDSQNYPVRSSHYINNYNWAVSSVTYENAIKILNSRIYLTDARFTDLASFKAFLAEETVQLMYPLAEPVTYQLAPAQILALSGQNMLTSNTGDTEVCGRLDMIPLLQSLMEKI